MNQFNVGDYVILRGNCSHNKNVATGERPYLCHGKYSCDEKERDADLVIIMKPDTKLVTVNQYSNGRFEKRNEYRTMVRVLSTKTHNVYEVDTEWADSFDKSEYPEHLQYSIEMSMMTSLVDEMMEDLYDDDYWPEY